MGFDKLPPGVTMTAEHMDLGQNVVPVVLEAKADAPVARPAGGHHRDARRPEDVVVPSMTSFDAVFSVGQNNTAVRAALSPRRRPWWWPKSAPFSIEVIEPKVPVVQNGSFNLRVVAKRAGGVQGPRSRCSRCGRRRVWAFKVRR